MSEVVDKLILEANIPGLIKTSSLGRGGQKRVYSCDLHDGKIVVVKIFETSTNLQAERARREIGFAKRLNNPRFSRLIEVKEVSRDNRFFFLVVEELLPGKDLRQILGPIDTTALAPAIAKRVILEVLQAVCIIEPMALVHRDIKPENILVSPDRVVLIDFGIARDLSAASATETYAFSGPMTLGYGAPEQIRNEKRKICSRTDLFAIGVVCYELLSGHNPFRFGSADRDEVVKRVLQYEPPPLTTFGYGEMLSHIVSRCMQKDLHRRPHSALYALSNFQESDWSV